LIDRARYSHIRLGTKILKEKTKQDNFPLEQ